MSSGQFVFWDTGWKTCDGWADEDNEVACDFEGLVEVWADRESNRTGWDCPVCKTEHAREF